jgi:replicative DNA helicase
MARDISESLGKLPPQAPDLEVAILGALMISKNSITEIAGILRPDHFYSEQNREVYEAIRTLFANGDPIDMHSVVAQLRKNAKLEIIGGAYYIAELTSKVVSAANIEYHSRIIIEMAMKRELIQLASTMHQDAYEDTVDVFEMINKYNLQMQDILDHAVTARAEKSMKELTIGALKEQQARQSGQLAGIPSGYHSLDALVNGFHKTDLIIVAARPSMGKTAFAVQAGKQVAETGLPVGVFSLEMGALQLVNRLVIAEQEIDSDRVQKGQLQDYEFKRFSDGCGQLMNYPMYIDDTAMLSIVELRARAMRMKAKYGIQLIIIDYLQLIKGLNANTRDQEIGQITRTLKGIAKELEIPIIALSQLSRAVETRGGTKRPTLSDLRESGSIEQDADVVMFLYRPEYYKITVDEDGFPTHGLCEVIVAKHRNGALDTAKLKFVGKFTKFKEWISEATGYQRPADQSQYISKHVKQVLPSEKNDEDFAKTDDLPF